MFPVGKILLIDQLKASKNKSLGLDLGAPRRVEYWKLNIEKTILGT